MGYQPSSLQASVLAKIANNLIMLPEQSKTRLPPGSSWQAQASQLIEKFGLFG